MTLLLILLAAATAGKWCVRPGPGLPRAEAWLFRMLTGVCVCAVVVLVVGSYSLLSAQVILAVLGAAGLIQALRAPRHAVPPAAEPRTGFDWVCLLVTVAALVLSFVGALAPVTSWDATVAHLALPSDYAREGRIFPDPGNVYSGYPHLMHVLYAAAYLYGGAAPAAVLSWCFAAGACAAVFALGRRLSGPRCGYIAMAILATAPIFMDQAGTVSIDLAFTAVSTAALVAVVAWFDEKRWTWLVLAGLLAGSACGVRHTGYVACFLLACGVLLGKSPHRWRAVLMFGGVSMLAAAPWLVRSALVTGNPVFPLLLSVFPAHTIEHVAVGGVGAHETVALRGGVSLWGFLRFPWDIVMRPHLYDGWAKSPGGMVLILGVPGFLLGGKRIRWAGAYGACGGAVFYFFQRFARYMLPFFAPLMVVAAAGALNAGRLRKPILGLLLFSFAYGLALDAAAVHFKAPVVLGWEGREAYLDRRVERYAAFAYANEHLRDGKLLTIDQRTYYVDGPTYQNHWALKRIAGLPLAEQVRWLKAQGIRYVLLPLDFIEESGAVRSDVGPMVQRWQETPRFFRPVGEVMNIPKPGGAGIDRVVFLEVR